MNTSLKKENNSPILIGLTGGIGSGKSTIAKIFKRLNIPVFNSDLEAKKIINNNPSVIAEVTQLLGDVYFNGEIQNRKVANIIFNDKQVLQQLNNIVHPRVEEAFQSWVNDHRLNKILIKEAAILIETGAYKKLDQLILVVADEKTRANRVTLRDKITEQEVIKKIKNQLSDDEKIPLSDFIIYNNDEDLLIPQVLNLLKTINT